jgi:prepilin-type processing-associated H-X9-DG protein
MLKAFTLASAAFFYAVTPVLAGCADKSFEGSNYTVCSFDPNLDRLATFNLDATGEPYGNFARLAAELSKSNTRLTFAMNAGMFDENLKPIGLYVENGKTLKKLNRRNGFGNFHLKPNGVFFLEGKKAQVLDTDSFVAANAKPDFASQSGPMLVIDGKIHPKFSETGTSFKIRNGVGVTKEGIAVFVLSHGVVTFHQFARVFRDGVNTPNALFFDGSVSGIYSTELGRNEGFLPLGPMVGVVEAR